ncbi:DoxX family protein [Tsukamurella spumae]|uniref:DoxX family protein n=1 Tax=Tsukamurella spumae TaxID=44753 RepID=UPI0031D31A19
MSDKHGIDNETSEGAAESSYDYSAAGELPRFGERHPTGGFVLDPHDDSDTGIGPVLPRYRDEPAGTAPAASSSGPQDTPPAAPSGDDARTTAVPDTSDLAAAITAASAATAAISTSGTSDGPVADQAAALSSEERDEFGKRYNRRRGRERAAQARAEAEGIPLESAATEEIAPPQGRRFGKPVGDVSAELDEARRAARRGTTDLGLLVLRVAVGVILVAHGVQKLFGIWGGPGIDGFARYLQNGNDPSVGFERFTKVLSIGTGVIELGGGAMLVLGLLTPIAAAGAVGVMLSAGLFKLTTAGHGFVFFAPNGVEYELMLVLAAVSILLAGPGRLSLDFGRGWARRPHVGSVIWLLVAIAGAVAVWVLLNGANPLVKR